MSRRIACMTATRADYPRVKSVLREIINRPNLELELIVTGTHLLKEFGYTIHEIENDGFSISSQIEMYSNDDSPYGMAKAAARCASGIADTLKDIKPDIFLLTVDRIETLAAAQSAVYMNIPVAHIQGGEVTGTIDESIRHAVTKLSHIHFPATIDAGERIIKMGEDPKNVYVVGCPYLDIIRTLEYKTKNELAKQYGFNLEKPLIIFIQHPVTTEYGHGVDQIKISIEALKRFPEAEIIAIYSNADAGGREIIATMREFSQFHIFPNIKSEDFLSLMKNANVMVGNSSTGIREAPSFRLPVVNIGTRQNGRLCAENVINVPHDIELVAKAIKKSLYDKEFQETVGRVTNPYGDGFSAKRIVDILENIELSGKLLQKRIKY
ncbi:MAG: UDP-N-acetyl-D-glucosamine 2-epimerase, UDP-hydrolysing [Nitrospirae bacterium RIFCSPHIGHO2_02_FULL_42_12]|nr:MAG: UDP-N-acetyl-D-glucosamine 2-epimerase, UDP-hydrolysing [Nitrospirae bacterium RIFCSPHIGHO2_02_FULL_42_12]